MRRRLVMMFVGLVFSGQLFAAVDLPEKYRQWIDQDVKYIVSNEDREHFLALEGDSERDAFIEEFWRRLDPYPVTPTNEFKEEYYTRLAYARDHFGLDGDQARVWVLLGKPNLIGKCPGQLGRGLSRDMICWYYWGLRLEGLPSYLQLTFFRRWDLGKYVLYSPLMDSPATHIVSDLPSAADRRWLNEYPAFGVIYGPDRVGLQPPPSRITGYLDPEAQVRAFVASAELQGTSRDPFDQEFIIQKLLLRGSELVQSSVKTSVRSEVALKGEETLPMDVLLASSGVEGEEFRLDVAIELQPAGITFEEIGKTYAARVDLIIRLSDARGELIVDRYERLPIELTAQQLERSNAFPLLYHFASPVIAGRYGIDVIAIDAVSGRSGRVEKTVTVGPQAGGEQAPLLAQQVVRDRFFFEGLAMGGAERHRVLGLEYLDAGQPDRAAAEFERSIHDNPTDFEVLLHLARARVQLEQYVEALEALDPVVWYDRWNVDALGVRSVALLRLGKHEDARGVLDEILRQHSGSVIALNHCANAFLEMGEKDRAYNLFCRSLELEPDQPQVKSAIEGLNR